MRVMTENSADHPILTARRPRSRRSLYEAAHKLDQPLPLGPPDRRRADEQALRRFDELADPDRGVVTHAGRGGPMLGALGVVYGDIGTSPLHTELVIFGSYGATAQVT